MAFDYFILRIISSNVKNVEYKKYWNVIYNIIKFVDVIAPIVLKLQC